MSRGLCTALVGLVAVAAVVAALLAAHGSRAQAQPVGSIALPDPYDTERTVQLYSGCNNVALTFPGGTASQTVIQAVTPAGAVESMWRHNPAEGKWDGYSPAFPEVGSLLTVNPLDAVWLCVTASTQAPGPSATSPTAQPTATPHPPAPATPTAASEQIKMAGVATGIGVNLENGTLQETRSVFAPGEPIAVITYWTGCPGTHHFEVNAYLPDGSLAGQYLSSTDTFDTDSCWVAGSLSPGQAVFPGIYWCEILVDGEFAGSFTITIQSQ